MHGTSEAAESSLHDHRELRMLSASPFETGACGAKCNLAPSRFRPKCHARMSRAERDEICVRKYMEDLTQDSQS